MKVRVGFFSFTCCEGCFIVFIEALNSKYEEWTSKIDIVNFRALKRNMKLDNLDVAFIEGAVSTKEELKKLKEIRRKSKMLVAFGSGAVTGYPSNQRNAFKGQLKKDVEPMIKQYKQLPTIEPLKKYVKVDLEINGCPINRQDVIKQIDELLKNAQT